MFIFAHTYNKDNENCTMNKSLRQRVTEMNVGDSMVVPVKDYGYTTIRSYASELGFALNRVYRTKRNREDRTYIITRTA